MASSEKKPSPKSASKSQIILELAEATKLSKKDVGLVVDALGELIKKSVGKKGTGAFILPGVFKVVKRRIPAKPAQKGVKVLGVIRDLPAKPARNDVKIRPLKALKDSALNS
jgi:nucleoid DNA-binding protein